MKSCKIIKKKVKEIERKENISENKEYKEKKMEQNKGTIKKIENKDEKKENDKNKENEIIENKRNEIIETKEIYHFENIFLFYFNILFIFKFYVKNIIIGQPTFDWDHCWC